MQTQNNRNPDAHIMLDALKLVLYCSAASAYTVPAYDAVAWSDGNHITKRRAWRMLKGIPLTPYAVREAALHERLRFWGDAMDAARQQGDSVKFGEALEGGCLVRLALEEMERERLDLKRPNPCEARVAALRDQLRFWQSIMDDARQRGKSVQYGKALQ